MKQITIPKKYSPACSRYLSRPIGGLLLGLSLLSIQACGSGSGDGIDPGVFQIPIAYIKRPIPTDDMGQPLHADLRDPLRFNKGGDVFLRTNSTVNAIVTNLTRELTSGRGDVKGLSVSFDATRLLFSARLFDTDTEDGIVPSWNIYEYEISSGATRRLITDDSTAESGNDISPIYLPDGRIVFTSDRQRGAKKMRLNEGKPGYAALTENGSRLALVLHIMNDDGTGIRQISFNKSHDLNPMLLTGDNAGQILFTRWDHAESDRQMQLYKIKPDGSDLELVYGRHSHATGTDDSNIQFVNMREMDNGDLMVIARPYTGTFDGGDIMVIDTERFADNDKPIWSLSGLTGPAQTSITSSVVTTDGSISADGRFSSVFPIKDGSGRLLVSKSSCQISVEVDGASNGESEVHPCISPWIDDESAQEVSPSYGVWLYDPAADTAKIIVLAESGKAITDAITVQPQDLPPIIFDKGPGEINTVWETAGLGVVNIRSVYDLGNNSFNGCFYNDSVAVNCTTATGINSVSDLGDPAKATADQRPARFVRFLKVPGFPDRDDPTFATPPIVDRDSFGRQRNLDMREILGYAPVEPDGSVKVKVPANVPLSLEVLDSEGRRIGPRHTNWFQVRAGDSVNCVGCHTHNTSGETPEIHARSGSAPSINNGLGSSLQFPNTLIPGNPSPAPYWGNLGETMAEVRFDRVGLSVPPAIEPQLSPDLTYVDYWTDPVLAGRPADTSYSYDNADLVGIPSTFNPTCTPWQSQCRSIINYAEHIHPIWQVDRAANTCTGCHVIVDAMDNDRVADAQLDLTDGMSDQNGDLLKSYRELFFNDQGEELVDNMLVNIQITVPVLDEEGVQVIDAMGNPVFEDINDPNEVVRPTMNAGGARNNYFIEKMTETELQSNRTLSTLASDPAYIDHSGFLSGAELKLISEWLDVGGQNFNNPFDPDAP